MSQYEALIRDNLRNAFAGGSESLAGCLPARQGPEGLTFSAFGASCTLTPEAVLLGGEQETGPRGLVVSLYAANATLDSVCLEPLIAFRDLPDSMPYQGAFAANTEQPLVPRASEIPAWRSRLLKALKGDETNPSPDTPGDISLLVFPLPKIALCYIVYLPDEEFTASVTCLFSNNARTFMPLDGLADTAEYATRRILELMTEDA
ncbi:MAG: DUF3786 domain-containing protein [Desulfobacteraceae bacterium]|jgi:hypothetical protein